MTNDPAPPTTSRRQPHPFILFAGIAVLATFTTGAAAGQPVSREEYDQMKRELAELRQEVRTLRGAEKTAPVKAAPAGALAGSFAEMGSAVDAMRSGEAKFLVTGSAEASFTAPRGGASNFGAVFEPIFLFQINKQLLFEGELEMELADGQTNTKLEYAQIDWSVNDYLTVIAGKFLNPMNVYVERYAPTWIRKLPDNPLGLYDGFLPESNVGLQLRGVVPIGPTHLNLAAYVSNAPLLVTNDPEALGTLDFENYDSLADAKAYGGRIGFAPCPNFEIGYGLQTASVRSPDSGSVSSLLQSVDASGHLDAAKGRFSLQAQYAWSHVGNMTYDANGALGVGPLNFTNDRNGGYVQLAYRGRQWDSPLVNKLEFIVRADQSNAPLAAPGGFDEQRLTFGVDYWIASATVLKAAYEFGKRNNGEPNADALLLQFSTGF